MAESIKIGFLYAGQGSQKRGMGLDLYEQYDAFRNVFDKTHLDFDLKEMCFSDPNNLLGQTRYTQPCMVAFAAGVTAVLNENGIFPDAAAGLSLGEYSALHAAGVFDAETAIEVAAFRGKAMEAASVGIESAMIAVLGLDHGKLQAACKQASGLGIVAIANYNCPGQLVIGGEKQAVEFAAALAKEAGARRCLPLRVSGPFHTPLMREAGNALADYFSRISFAQPKIPVVFNCLGNVKSETDSIQQLLIRQVQSSVHMEDTIRCMETLGMNLLVEIGPGNVLTGFIRKTLPDMQVFTVETVADIEKLLAHLHKEDNP